MADTTSTTQFKADISQLKSAMQQAQRQVKLANSEFKAASAGMDDWSDSADGLRAKLKQLDTTLKAQKTQLNLLEDEYEKTVTVYGENSAAADRVKISMNNMKASIAKTESQINSYEAELVDCENGTGRFADSIDEADEAAENAGDGFTVFKGILSDLVSNIIQSAITSLKDLATEVVEVGSSFEKSMANVQALSGATEEELQLLSDTAKEFGSSTQFSASEAADALSYMALAGWDAKTSCDALGGVLDLAASSGMDLAEASDMVTDYLSAFGMEAEDSAYFADLLSYAQSNANTTAEGLGEAYKNCAANMSAAGQDIETTTALLSSMANQGLKGSEAGTALTAVMRDMTSKMEDGAISIGETSVKVQDAQGNFRDLTDILKDVESATEGMGDAEKSSALMATFTSDSIKGLNLILNAGVDSTADFEEQLRSCDGTAKDMANTMNDTLSGDITALNSKLEGIKITIYESMAPALREAVAQISEVLDTVDWEEKGKQIGDIAVKAVDFFSKIVANADGVKSVLEAIGISLGTAFVVSKVATFASSIISLWKTFQTLRTATEAATTSQLLLNAAQAATPVGLVTAAVAALAAGIVYLASKTNDVHDATDVLTESERQQVDRVYELRDAYVDLQTARDENISAINTEYSYYEELANELNGLVDANGQVKEGYEDRVNFILTTLNDACGTEMELVDGVIQNYKDEKDAITDLINTKKAEAVLNASEEAYTDAVQNRNEALQNVTTTTGIYNQNVKDLEAAEKAYNDSLNMTTEEYMKLNNYTGDAATASIILKNEQEALKKKVDEAKGAVGESRFAMDQAKDSYENYVTTIQNYEGLSSAIISGDADKIADALTDLEYNFKTAETATKESLEQQVEDYEANLKALQEAIDNGTPGVTEAMVDQAETMVSEAKKELDKASDEFSKSANAGAKAYGDTLGSTENQAYVKGKSNLLLESTKDGVKDSEKEGTEKGDNFGKGYEGGILKGLTPAERAATQLGDKSYNALKTSIDEGSPSRKTTTSGENFGQGFINGMNNKTSSVWTTAWNLAKTALNALKEGQKEGSPSKLTKKSGVYFVQGYTSGIITESNKTIKKTVNKVVKKALNTVIKAQKSTTFNTPSQLTYSSGQSFVNGYINGIASMEQGLKSSISNMMSTTFKEALNLKNFNINEAGSGVKDTIVDKLSDQSDYMINKLTYQNEKKIAEYDNTIAKLEVQREKRTSAVTKASDKQLAKLNKEVAKLENKNADLEKSINTYESTNKTLESKLNNAKTEKEKANINKQIKLNKRKIADAESEIITNNNYIKEKNKYIKQYEKTSAKEIAAIEKEYEKLIATQEKYKDAYTTASQEMISEFTQAINEYSSKAQELIDSTIGDIADKYDEKYNALLNKQNNLIDKLQSAGDLFNVSGAGVMTVNSLQEQTKAIKEYTDKLKKIKNKVSSELFEQIASYDMKEGSAFMDRLLAMSSSDLNAYNKAYTEKMEAAQKAGEGIYKSDFDKIAKDYKTEINKAFKDIPAQLEALGNETMKGFVNGLTKNTDYMTTEVKTFVSSMVNQFKSELKIASPSKVMEVIGDYTGEGLVNGLKSTIGDVKKVANDMAQSVATPLNGMSANIGSLNNAVSSGVPTQNTTVVNNYNLNQNNYSPKSLSALETYQARRQQLAMVKAMT